MIRLFRHDGLEIMLNIDMIKDISAGPPTMLTLIDGEKIEVKNTPNDVLTKIRACRKGREDEGREFDLFPKKRRNGSGEPGRKVGDEYLRNVQAAFSNAEEH